MAIATATATFTNGGAETAAFTWTPALTSNPPKVLALSVTVTTAGQGAGVPFLDTVPTNIGGSVGMANPPDCTVTIVASD